MDKKKIDDLCCIGDEIQCHVENPTPATLRARLDTTEAVAMGNDLIMDKNSGWTKTVKCKHPEEHQK